MPKGINILVVDDEKLFRSGVVSMLHKRGANIVGEAGNGEEMLPMIKSKKPDVILLDLEMPKLNGSKALNKIRRNHPDQRVIILSKYHDEELIKDTFNRGANAFISKKICGIEVVLDAIQRVHEFGVYKDNVPCLYSNPAIKDGHYYRLIFSAREVEILYWICQSMSYKQIGAQLFISANTVENHAKSLFKKTSLKGREELVTLAFRHGLNYLGGH